MRFRREHRGHSALAASDSNTLMRDLLAYAAANQALSPGDSAQCRLLEGINDRQLQYVMDAGLAPLLYRAVRDRIDRLPERLRNALLSADLTAQLRHGNLVDTAVEVIDACQEIQVPVTLLKGISISEQHYPLPHLRPMGDIDILVPQEACESVESALLGRGYTPRADFKFDEESYHIAPLLHPERHVWVEIHMALFPNGAPLRCNGVFNSSQLAAQSVASTFHGRPVLRFSNELQLAYLASFWIRDLSRHESHPSFVPPLLDAIYILQTSSQAMDWDALLSWLDNDMAIASLYLMLSYLSRHGLIHPVDPIISRLRASQSVVGDLEVKMIHAMLDNYLLEGRPFTRLFHSSRIWDTLLRPGSSAAKLLLLPWNVVFPRSSPDRYKLRYQLERIPRLLGRL